MCAQLLPAELVSDNGAGPVSGAFWRSLERSVVHYLVLGSRGIPAVNDAHDDGHLFEQR